MIEIKKVKNMLDKGVFVWKPSYSGENIDASNDIQEIIDLAELKESEYQATITKLNKLTQTINSHGPDGRNYTNQQYVDLLLKFENLQKESAK